MKGKKIGNGIYLIKGLLLSYLVTIVLILFFSLIVTYSTIKEGRISLFNTITMITSITTGSIYVSRKLKENGWINGCIIGLSYYLILLLLNFALLRPFVLDVFSISKLLIAIIVGLISGIIGINIF